MSDHLLRPTASNIASYKEIFDKNTNNQEVKSSDHIPVRPIPARLLAPTASIIHYHVQRYEDRQQLEHRDDIWWETRPSSKSDAIRNVPNIYDHVSSRLSESTIATRMRNSSSAASATSSASSSTARSHTPIRHDSRLLAPTYASLYHNHNYHDDIMLQYEDVDVSPSFIKEHPTPSLYNHVESRLFEPTASAARSAYKSKEDMLLEDELRREYERHESKKVHETAKTLLIPTSAFQNSCYRSSLTSSSSSASTNPWKPITYSQGEELLTMPLEASFPFSQVKVSETSSHILKPTKAYQQSCYNASSKMAMENKHQVDDANKKDSIPISDRLLIPTETMIKYRQAKTDTKQLDPREVAWSKFTASASSLSSSSHHPRNTSPSAQRPSSHRKASAASASVSTPENENTSSIDDKHIHVAVKAKKPKKKSALLLDSSSKSQPSIVSVQNDIHDDDVDAASSPYEDNADTRIINGHKKEKKKKSLKRNKPVVSASLLRATAAIENGKYRPSTAPVLSNVKTA